MVDRVKARPRRCGASLPHEDADDGHRWCVRSVHGPDRAHMDETGFQWKDGDTVTVTTVEEMWAHPHHVHSFTGDEDYCTRGCPLAWRESRGPAYQDWAGDPDD